MGADLILGFVEIAKRKKPNWSAAKAYLKKLSEKDMLQIALEAEQTESVDDLSENFSPKVRILESLDHVIGGWDGMRRLMARCEGVKTTILIAADSSWGDPVDEVADIEYFVVSGMAHAAGFFAKKRAGAKAGAKVVAKKARSVRKVARGRLTTKRGRS